MITFQATVTGTGATALDARLDAESRATALDDDRVDVASVNYGACYETLNPSGEDLGEWACSAFVELTQTAA